MQSENKERAREIADFYEKYCLTVYRVCFSYLKNESDASDIMQDTFMKWLTCKNPPHGEKHETAWLVMTAGNLCKNFLKSYAYSKREDLSETDGLAEADSSESREILDAVLSLPPKYKAIVYLYYYEGLSTLEIAEYSGENHATVRSRLRRAREILRKKLGDEQNG